MSPEKRSALGKKEPLSGAFFWLSAFYFIYCARPEDWIHILSYIPLAKITAIFAMLSLFVNFGKTPRRFKDLPKEASYLLVLIVLLFASAFLSPVWKGGAFFGTIDFAKVYIAWIMTFLLITTLPRLRRIIFIQAVSVAIISFVAIVKGHSIPRLNGVIGGIYSNPNDLAFAIVLSLPFCLAFFVASKSTFRKSAWCLGMLAMATALFLTASRAGFIDLVIAGAVCLWHFGVKGKRLYLIAGALLVGVVLLPVAGKTLEKRFSAISSDALGSQLEERARGSYEERKILINKSIDAMLHYPILGVGVGNFVVYSEIWKTVHVSYLQVGAEGGIAVLILYLLFFRRGFVNVNFLRRSHADAEAKLFAGALHSSLVGFVVGACFAPEAYQYFPYFAVCYTSVLVAMVKERQPSTVPAVTLSASQRRLAQFYGRSRALNPAR